jgi:hypothetical protein
MLGSLNNMFSKLKNHKLVSSMTDNYGKIRDKVLKKITITEIEDRLYHIDYPQ